MGFTSSRVGGFVFAVSESSGERQSARSTNHDRRGGAMNGRARARRVTDEQSLNGHSWCCEGSDRRCGRCDFRCCRFDAPSLLIHSFGNRRPPLVAAVVCSLKGAPPVVLRLAGERPPLAPTPRFTSPICHNFADSTPIPVVGAPCSIR
uniref:Uncharacterized protein n=1 Tax=Plectus sambesii TaxID=2011161 RepID=A0A914VG63_9BILA